MAYSGHNMVKSSFVAGISEMKSFGTLRVPKLFLKEFGTTLPKAISFTCKGGIKWEAMYDSTTGNFTGLESFMKTHEVKQMYILLLDYLGNGNFIIKIYNSSGLEANYSGCLSKNCRNIPNSIKESQFILGLDSLEDEKARSRFFFSGFGRDITYFEKIVQESDMDPRINKMLLPTKMSILYTEWKSGKKIQLCFLEKTWDVKIEFYGEKCYLGSGWHTFAVESGLEKNDILVFSALFTMVQNLLNVCLFKSEDIQICEKSQGLEDSFASFFHVFHQHTMLYKEIVPPMLVSKYYGDMLAKVDTVRCGKITYPVSYIYYQNGSQALINLDSICENYGLTQFDTFFITMYNSNEANIRIYRRDGMEVEYESQGSQVEITTGHWFMKDTWKEDYSDVDKDDFQNSKKKAETVNYVEIVNISDDSDVNYNDLNEGAIETNEVPVVGLVASSDEHESEDVGNQAMAHENLGEFTCTLLKSHVNKHCHGVYINQGLNGIIGNWTSGKVVFFRRGGHIWNIGINETNGRKRFSAGWDKFVRESQLKVNDRVGFTLQGDRDTFDIQINGN